MESSHFTSVVGAAAHGIGGRSQKLRVAGVAVLQRKEERLRLRRLFDAFESPGRHGTLWKVRISNAARLLAIRPDGWNRRTVAGSTNDAIGNKAQNRRVNFSNNGAACHSQGTPGR